MSQKEYVFMSKNKYVFMSKNKYVFMSKRNKRSLCQIYMSVRV